MKKILISFVLVFAVISSICAVAANSVDASNTPTVIENAVSLGITENADISLSESIAREQFCEYTYNILNSVKELPTFKLSENPFTDTNNPKITSLYLVKIVNGKDPQVFAPKDNISREEAAVILCRAAMYADLELPSVKVEMSYSNNGSIPPLGSILCL